MDHKLVRYYRSALSRYVWLIVFVGAWLNVGLWVASDYVGGNAILKKLVSGLLSFSVIAWLYLRGEKAIRTQLWRLAYPELDLHGRWSGATTYARRHDVSATQSAQVFQPFHKPNDVLLRQDCLGIASGFEESQAGPCVRYAYHVSYGGEPGFPDAADGYEELRVQSPSPGKRPTLLQGTFAHCASGSSPWYSGSVSFRLVEEASPASASMRRRLCLALATVLAKLGKPRSE
jgi:hypothetical protein